MNSFIRNKGYLYISNGRIVPKSQEDSLAPVHVSSFDAPCLWAANEMGFKLYEGINRTYATQVKNLDYDITYYNQHIYRSIFDLKAIEIGYRNLCLFLESHPDIAVIHCNTPIGGLLGRICGKKYGKTVIYMVHGFHFYKGAPLINRVVFKSIEKWLAHKTDCLITINHEDYEAAQSLRLNKGGKTYQVNGVGVDLKAFDNVDVDYGEKRQSLGLPRDAIVGIVVGDLNENKNVGTIIRALSLAGGDIHLLICGLGPLESRLKGLAKKYGVQERCHFLGFRTDIKALYKVSDMFLFASQREGLPRSTMEAMLAGLPCLVSSIRGNVDLIDHNKGGLLFPPKDYESLAEAIKIMAESQDKRKEFGEYNKVKIKAYDIEIVKQQMLDVYKEVCVL